MPMVQKRTNSRSKSATNPPDWSALMPVLPGEGPRARALYRAIRQLIEGGRVPAGATLPTTRDLAIEVLASEPFRTGDYSTSTLEALRAVTT